MKGLPQDYRNAVTVGRRSGSGKLVEDNWDILKNIWRGSLAVINLRNARCFLQNELSDKEDNESGNMNGENVSGDESQQLDGNIEEPIAKKSSGGLAPTAKFVDKKRKLLEKNLSANQRDQVYLNLAKEDLKLKQDLHGVEEASRESNKALNEISHSISTFGKSIGDGLALLASALSNAQSNPTNSHTSATNSYPQRHQSFPFTPPGYQQQNMCFSQESSYIPRSRIYFNFSLSGTSCSGDNNSMTE